MRLRYYPVGVGVFLTVGLVALYGVRSSPTSDLVDSEVLEDRQVELLLGTKPPAEGEPRPAANPDAGEGARAKRESGRVGKRDLRMQRARGSRVEVKKQQIDRAIAENPGVLGALRDAGEFDGMFGSGGLGVRGSGLGGGGSAEGVGGLIGTKGSGRSGYGSGGGRFGARGSGARGSIGLPAAPLSMDTVHPGHNPTELVERDWLSTFSIDVDTASYTQARRSLQAGRLPQVAAVRTEEFVNYFRYDYPEPEAGRAFSITMDGSEHPWTAGHHVLRVGIKGAEEHERTRRPVHLTFLVDTSGSMYHPDKLPLVKRSLEHLVERLHEGDTVAIATYAGSSRVVLPTRDASHRPEILDAIRGLQTGGGTAMQSGMELAYREALAHRRDGEESRVIVLSDGDANIGGTSHEQILDGIATYAQQGITLSTIGFGTGNYRDALMEQLADRGDGNYTYVDSMDEARRVFGEDLGATLRTIARDVKIQVEFNPHSVLAYTLIGYENRAIADADFRRDEVDAGEIGAGHTVTALYDVVLRDRPDGPLATVRVRHKEPGPDQPARELAVDVSPRTVDRVFEAGSRDLRRAWGVGAFAEKLRGAESMAEVSWAEIVATLDRAERPGDERDAEVVELARTAQRLARNQQISAVDVLRDTDPTILGNLEPRLVHEVVQRYESHLRYCYQRELVKEPTLAGRVDLRFVIDRNGVVSDTTVEQGSGNGSLDACVRGRFARMRFPAPAGGGVVVVRYPMVFSPA